MNKLSAILLATLLVPQAAVAASINLPDDKPLASVTIPDSWHSNKFANGVEGGSADGGIYLAFEVAADQDLDQAVQAAIDIFIKDGIEVDLKTQNKQKVTVNGMDAYNLSWAGKNTKSGESVKTDLTILPLDPEHFLIVSNWGTAEAEKANAAELQTIAKSIKKLN